jgi:hypothetical protein
MIASTSLGVGVLSNTTVPRSRRDAFDKSLCDLRWVVHHHAPNADPTTPAIIPRVRLVTSVPPAAVLSNIGTS